MLTTPERRQRIETIRGFPEALASVVTGLDTTQLHTRYLPEEWSLQQIVHHMADSHMNSLIRLKLILTMENPILQSYPEPAWALLPDVDLPIQVSLDLLRALHQRWCAIWDTLQDTDWERTGRHTESGLLTIEDLLIIYDQHCRDHLDQVRRVLAAMPTA